MPFSMCMASVGAWKTYGKEALQLFCQMRLGGVQPNQITILCILDACTQLAALEEGQAIHAEIVEEGYEANIIVGTALINMYGKCGNLGAAAKSVQGRILGQKVVSWTALITMYAKNGCGNEALQLFQEMQLESVKPNEVTFISVLIARSQSGQVADGRRYFMSMYNGFVALYVHDRSSQSLRSCRTHHDVERGVRAASCCFVMDPKNARPYVMLSGIFAAAGRWDALKHAVLPGEDSSKVSKMMHECLQENNRRVELQS